MQRLAFTVKDNRKDQTDYQPLFHSWTKKGCVINCKYQEYDSKGKLHYHGIVTIPDKTYRMALCPKGFSFKLKPIHDEEGWIHYIQKDQVDLSEDTDDNYLMSCLNRPLFKTA